MKSPENRNEMPAEAFSEKENAAEFSEITKKDIKEIIRLYHEIFSLLGQESIPEFNKYLGNDDYEIGQHGTFYNTSTTLHQFEFALAMTRSPILKKMVSGKEWNERKRSDFDADFLVESKIMQGMKVLDLGSGPQPVFARCCRYMGANVWTVDGNMIPKNYDDQRFPKEQQELEQQHHITLDLNNPSAMNIIREKAGEEFNLITSANLLNTGTVREPEWNVVAKLAKSLLQKGGIYNEDGGLREIYLKDESGGLESYSDISDSWTSMSKYGI